MRAPNVQADPNLSSRRGSVSSEPTDVAASHVRLVRLETVASLFLKFYRGFFSAGEGEPQVVVQAAHHQGGRDQLVEEPEPRHLHRQGLQHLPRLLWPGLEGFPPCSKLHNTKKDISGGNSSTERATAADKWATEFGRAGEQLLLKSNRS